MQEQLPRSNNLPCCRHLSIEQPNAAVSGRYLKGTDNSFSETLTRNKNSSLRLTVKSCDLAYTRSRVFST